MSFTLHMFVSFEHQLYPGNIYGASYSESFVLEPHTCLTVTICTTTAFCNCMIVILQHTDNLN